MFEVNFYAPFAIKQNLNAEKNNIKANRCILKQFKYFRFSFKYWIFSHTNHFFYCISKYISWLEIYKIYFGSII